jgi:anti-sigma regulatory factor (Ser/Thr protein kinase)
MGCPFRDVNRNGDAHFCPRTCPAPYIESRTDIFRPLTHPAKTPVRIALVGLRLRIFVQGKPRTLNPAIHEQLFLIGREAVINALRHSEATKIEVEVQYLRDLLRVLVRDNGCGIAIVPRRLSTSGQITNSAGIHGLSVTVIYGSAKQVTVPQFSNRPA